MRLWMGKLPSGDLRALQPEQIKRLKIGECYEFEFKLTRDLKLHRKFFAFLTALHGIESIQARYSTIEQLRYALTIEAGYFEQVIGFNGEIYIKAKSIAFKNMEDADFSALKKKMLDIMVQDLPRHTPEDIQNLENAVLKFY